jgi:two-component system, NarL family, sensor histidine kinase DesK
VSGNARSAAAPARWWGPLMLGLPASELWHLCWLGILVYAPLLDPVDPLRQWLFLAGVVVVFVPFYVAVERRPGRLRDWSPALTAMFAVAVTPFNAGGSVLFVYAAAFAANYLSRRAATWWLPTLSVLLVVLAFFSTIPMPWRTFAFVPSLVLIWVVGLMATEHNEQDRLARFHNAQVEHLATLSERERISRDLHDLLGQTLTGIVVRSQLAQRLATADVDAGIAEMAQVEQAARAALSEVRATVSGWRQVDLDQELIAARDALGAAGVALTVTRDPGLVLTPSAETALGLALREAVTNVVRHAHANRCTVALRQTGERVVLEVTDDGVGGEQREGNGLAGMRERIAALGGDVQRNARDGTALTVAVPAAVAT